MADPDLTEEPEAQVERAEPLADVEQFDLPKEPAEDSGSARATRFSSSVATALLRRRFLAGSIDLALALTTLGVLVVGALLQGVAIRIAYWPAFLLTLLDVSFLYTVFALTFWGRTPGMAYARLVARTANGEPLTTAQAVLRWLGGLATVALLGLPTLLALRDQTSLTDWASRSRVAS